MRFKLPRAAHLLALLAVATAAAVVVAPGAVGAGSAGGPVAIDATTGKLPLTLQRGPVEVSVTLSDPSVSVAARQGLSSSQQRSYENRLASKQTAFSNRAKALGARELASVTTALNAVILRIHSSKIRQLRAMKGVLSVRPINDYELDLSETVPYIGAAAAQADGVNGTGIDVAVIDSGVDYTHENFGGPGDAAAYTAAYGTSTGDARNKSRDGLFPTAKVLEGFDFVGEAWNGTASSPPLAPDPDPIDCGPFAIPCAGGHGSHVSDIILGIGPNKGVAPGAKLFSYKACSAVSTSCSGVALLQAVDAAVDPNGDGSTADRADVINLSLGSSYGQIEDDLSFALANATKAGSVVVASAGNSADRPYITGSPSSTPEVISVAQTQVPSAQLNLIVAGAVTAGVVHQPWSPEPTAVTGALTYDTTNAGTRLGCSNAAGANPYAPGSHTGQILLMDRGSCAVSFKVANAASSGAIAAVVANNLSQAPGDLPPTFSFGGGVVTISGYTVTLADGNALKTVLGTSATIDPAGAASLVRNMVASSSRGPNYSFNAIKPDIGAPGASVSTEAGTGNGETAFGGTSGAAPMVAGSAALLLDKNGHLSVSEVKSLLMNTGETNIGLNPVGLPGVLAPITRIGGGEVRVDKALASGTAAWGSAATGGSLSFGYHAISKKIELEKTVTVKNYGHSSRTYTITPSFRYADDAASGAVKIDAPKSIRVSGKSTKKFEVELRIDPSKLPNWEASGLNGGPTGGDGYRLQGLEFDGYIAVNGGTNNNVHVAWQVLPHRSADVDADDSFKLKNGTAKVEVENDSKVLDGRLDLFALTGTSGKSATARPKPGDNFALIDLRAVGVREAAPGIIQFAIDTYGARSHPAYPAEFDIVIDRNRDGIADVVLFTAENGAFASTGQTVVFVDDLAVPGGIPGFFFADAELNSGNMIMTAPMSVIGITSASAFDFSVEAYDNYFTGALTDSIATMTHTLATPKYMGTGLPAAIPAKGEAKLNIATVAGGDLASPSQTGFLLMYRDAEGVKRTSSKNEADTVEVKTKKKHDDDD